MKFTTKQELYDYLNNFNFESYRDTEISEVYFLVEFNNHVEPILFVDFCGSFGDYDWWLEYGCTLYKYPYEGDKELMDYVKETYEKNSWQVAYEYQKTLCRGDWMYEIICFQSEPFLPDEINIIKPLTESECLDWMLQQK